MFTNRRRRDDLARRLVGRVIGCLLAALCAPLTGCGAPTSESAPIEISGLPPMLADDGEQDSETGPHGGRLIELGHNRKYRAELVVDITAAEVRLHVLDRNLRAVGIADQQATLNIFVDGAARTYQLPALPIADAIAKSQRQAFGLQDRELAAILASAGPRLCKVRLFIDDKAYIGLLAYNAKGDKGLASDNNGPVEYWKR